MIHNLFIHLRNSVNCILNYIINVIIWMKIIDLHHILLIFNNIIKNNIIN